MSENYYQKQLFLAAVDLQDVIIGPVERWKAHTEGILHRGFTVILTYQGTYLLQHRKHLAFDGYWDLTFSSHQLMIDGRLQSDKEAMYETLLREWNVTKDDVEGEFQKKGKVYYKAKDSKSIYTEHEFDYVYVCALKTLPKINEEFAYEYEILKLTKSTASQNLSKFNLAPWVQTIVEEVKIF